MSSGDIGGPSGAEEGSEPPSAAPSSGSGEPSPSAGSPGDVAGSAGSVADAPAPSTADPPAPTPAVAADDAAPSSDAPPPEPAESDVESATAQDSLLGELRESLGDSIVGSESRRGDLWVRVRPEAWHRAAEVCRSLGFDYFCFLSGIDWMPSTAPNPKAGVADVDTGDDGADDAGAPSGTNGEVDAAEADAVVHTTGETIAAAKPETGLAGGDTRFQVFARLYSVGRHVGVTLKADLDDDAPQVASWADVYAGADWHERETWEMFGFDFVGHPGLTHMYLPGEFEGFPMRKDFPLLAREVKPWPGLVDVEPMPEDPEADGAEQPATAEAGAESTE